MSYRQIQDVTELSLNGLSFWDGSPIQKFYFLFLVEHVLGPLLSVLTYRGRRVSRCALGGGIACYRPKGPASHAFRDPLPSVLTCK